MPSDEYDQVDGRAVALDLIQSGTGVVTPYGVVYDNGMKLEQVYDGRHFPAYLYEMPQMMIEIKSGPKDKTTGCLYLPLFGQADPADAGAGRDRAGGLSNGDHHGRAAPAGVRCGQRHPRWP